MGFLRNKQDVFDALIRVKKRIYDQDSNISHKQRLFETIERTRAKSFLHVINNSEINEKSTSNDTEINRGYGQEIEKEISELWSKMNNFKTGEKSQFDNIRKEDLYLTLLAERKNKEMTTKKEAKVPDLKEIQESILDEKNSGFRILSWRLGFFRSNYNKA